MPKRGHHLLTAGADVRAEPIVTYTRVSAEESASGQDRRIEPHFTAVRLDRRGRPIGARREDDLSDLPLVDAPPSDVLLDPLAEVSAGEIRVVRRRRGSRIAALAGALAIVAGAGVLAATYGGLSTLDNPDAVPPITADAGGEAAVLAAADQAPADDANAARRAVRVVSADQIPAPLVSETAALAPRAAADPVAGEAALSDQATVSGEAALSAEPPGRVIVDPPLPRLRPATARYPAPPAPDAFAATPMADPFAPAPAGVVGSGDVDNALANVDRILMEQRAAAGVQGSGDGDFYADVGAPGMAATGPSPYPPNTAQAYPAGEPYGPSYPGQEPYVAGPAYPPAQQQMGYPPQPAYPGQPAQLYPGVNLAADVAPDSPWWLPKRRALVIPNAPVPPAEIPTGQGAVGVW